MMILLIWVVIIIAVLVYKYRQIYSTFSRNAVKQFTPLPLLGNMGSVIFRVEHTADSLLRLYFAFPGERFVGRYEYTQEMVVIRDIELAKKITIKDFEYFLDHRDAFRTDSFFSRSLIALQGQEWKDMRSTLSPAFTSSKMRQMVPFMTAVGDQMIRALQKKINDSRNGQIEVECKDLTTRYTNDVIASCAFGLKVDSHNDENNEFYAMGKKSSTFTYIHILLSFFYQIMPTRVVQYLNWDFLPKDSQKFFRKLVLGMMEEREKKKIIRPDMIHLLMLAKRGQLTHEDTKSRDDDAGFATVEESAVGHNKHNREWSDDDFIAQAVLFFVAGFETSSACMSFLLHELAMNPDVQERLAQEIKETDARNGGKFDFNTFQDMPYMDMVISELLRKWPTGVVFDRVCNKDYNLGKPNDKADKDFIVRKGTVISIPLLGFHRDPQYFPDPEKFDPERFSEENRHKIRPYSYMPFGSGPRNCIGARFALSKVKSLTYQILLNFELSPSEKTCIPARFDTGSLTVKLAGGHWLRFCARK